MSFRIFRIAGTIKGAHPLADFLGVKITAAAILTTGIWAVVYGLEIHALFTKYSVQILSAPVQNLAMLENLENASHQAMTINCSRLKRASRISSFV